MPGPLDKLRAAIDRQAQVAEASRKAAEQAAAERAEREQEAEQ